MDYREIAEELLLLRMEAFGQERRNAHSTRGEDGALLWLYLHDGKAIAGSLAKALSLTSGRIANILKQLETKGFITRSANSEDRRRINVLLTQSGQDYIRRLYEEDLDTCSRLLEKLGKTDAQEYLRISREITEVSLRDRKR